MKKKLKIYLDTSVISHLDQQDVPEKMEQTLALWQIFQLGIYDIVISDLVLAEIQECEPEKRERLIYYLSKINYERVSIDDEVEEIANEIVNDGILNPKSYDDCVHIAAAIVNDCNIIVSWNFKHMVNLKTINGVRKITFEKRYNSIDIYAPFVLLENNDKEEK